MGGCALYVHERRANPSTFCAFDQGSPTDYRYLWSMVAVLHADVSVISSARR